MCIRVSLTLNGYFIFLGQLVDPLQADVAPGSNIIVPNRYANQLIVLVDSLDLFRHPDLLTCGGECRSTGITGRQGTTDDDVPTTNVS